MSIKTTENVELVLPEQPPDKTYAVRLSCVSDDMIYLTISALEDPKDGRTIRYDLIQLVELHKMLGSLIRDRIDLMRAAKALAGTGAAMVRNPPKKPN